MTYLSLTNITGPRGDFSRHSHLTAVSRHKRHDQSWHCQLAVLADRGLVPSVTALSAIKNVS